MKILFTAFIFMLAFTVLAQDKNALCINPYKECSKAAKIECKNEGDYTELCLKVFTETCYITARAICDGR